MRTAMIICWAVLAVLFSAAVASAGVRSATFEVGGSDDCFADTRYSLPLPARAAEIEVHPSRNDLFRDPATGAEAAYVSSVRGNQDGSRKVTWTVTSSRCVTFGSWSIGAQRFEARFRRVDARPALSAQVAKKAARLWLRRRFEFYPYSEGKDLSCGRRVAASRRRCRFSFFGGDVSFLGGARVSLFSEPSTDYYARLRFRVTKTNHYCIAVEDKPRSQCRTTNRGSVRVD